MRHLPSVVVLSALVTATLIGCGSPVSSSHVGVSGRPLVIAHRGFSWIAPENTLVAYQKAIDIGVGLAECDVYLSKDGVPVCFHDKKLDRTSDGEGAIGDRTLAELKQLDAGSWKSPDFAGERIPTLVELLKLVKGRLRLVIEIKQTGMEQEVIDALKATDVEPDAVMIFSFDYETVRRIAELEPELPTTWLIGKLPEDKAARREAIRKALRARVSALGCDKDRVDAAFVRLAHECGFPVFVWTVNEEARMTALVEAGVDAIITDRPDVAQKLLASIDSE